MSLIYFITSLPRLHFGSPPPLARSEFVRRLRSALPLEKRQDFEIVMLLEETEESLRLTTEGLLAEPPLDVSAITSTLVNQRRHTPLGGDPRDLPDWIKRVLPQHVALRMWHHAVYERTSSAFLQQYVRFLVRLSEVIVGLLCKQAGYSESEFLSNMEAAFGSTFKVLRTKYDQPDLGVGDRFSWYPRVKMALMNPDLTEMERDLDRLRWAKLDELRGTELFSMDTVLCYYFQLRILERQAAWNATKGREVLEEMMNIDLGEYQ